MTIMHVENSTKDQIYPDHFIRVLDESHVSPECLNQHLSFQTYEQLIDEKQHGADFRACLPSLTQTAGDSEFSNQFFSPNGIFETFNPCNKTNCKDQNENEFKKY